MNNLLEIDTFPIGRLNCNCSIISSPKTKEAIIVDPGNDAVGLLRKLREKELVPKLLLHTHAHFDHIGKSPYLKQTLGVPLYLHKGDLPLYNMLIEQGLFFGEETSEPVPIDHFLEDEENIGFQEVEDKTLSSFIKTLHTPGHTPGSCCFYTEYFSVPILFSGDTLFLQSIGRTDLPGGDFGTIKSSIKTRLYTLPEETRCIPGHGPDTTIYGEKKNNPFVTS